MKPVTVRCFVVKTHVRKSRRKKRFPLIEWCFIVAKFSWFEEIVWVKKKSVEREKNDIRVFDEMTRTTGVCYWAKHWVDKFSLISFVYRQQMNLQMLTLDLPRTLFCFCWNQWIDEAIFWNVYPACKHFIRERQFSKDFQVFFFAYDIRLLIFAWAIIIPSGNNMLIYRSKDRQWNEM